MCFIIFSSMVPYNQFSSHSYTYDYYWYNNVYLLYLKLIQIIIKESVDFYKKWFCIKAATRKHWLAITFFLLILLFLTVLSISPIVNQNFFLSWQALWQSQFHFSCHKVFISWKNLYTRLFLRGFVLNTSNTIKSRFHYHSDFNTSAERCLSRSSRQGGY